jgi:hypothetical protein
MRLRSAAIMSGRLSRRWSTQLPMNSEARFGSQTAAVSRPTWPGEASSMVTAINGRASSVIRSPTSETPCADQKMRN